MCWNAPIRWLTPRANRYGPRYFMYPVTARSSTAGRAREASAGKDTENSFVPVLM